MNKDNIYTLIKHTTRQMGENQLYFVVPAFNDVSISFEILWKKENKLPWSFTLRDADNWTECSSLDILDALEEIECDLVDFKQQIVSKMITQVAYMNMRIKSTRELIGDEAVDAGIHAYDDFGKALAESVGEMLGNKTKTKLSLVKGK